MKQGLWIIIPAHNEGSRIRDVIKGCKKHSGNIIVVDDGSKDDTVKVAASEGVKVLKHIINLGKGAALKTGCMHAIKNNAKIIVVLDADGQHEPAEIPNFIKALEECDIVFGYRQRSKNMPFILRFGNNLINKATKLIYKIRLHDTQSGYRAFKALIFPKIEWKAADYSMESEMVANVGKHRLNYTEIPIKTIYSDKYKGTTILDGIKIVFNMIKWKIFG